MTLSGPHLSPFSGSKPDSLVVLIHGYGADGKDLISLGRAWTKELPSTLFVAPHGPAVCEMSPMGKQWFGLQDWDPNRLLREMQLLTPSFHAYVHDLIKIHEIPSNKVAFVGFSQGAMLALYMGFHYADCAGILAYSGAFLDDVQEKKSEYPPVLLVHGEEDDVLPPSYSHLAEEHLKNRGVPVSFSLLSGLGHGIDGRGLELGGEFLKNCLYEKAAPLLVEKGKTG